MDWINRNSVFIKKEQKEEICYRKNGTLPCCALGAQISPPLIFDFSNSSPCRALTNPLF